jgi:GTPase SAR1 family protein
MTLDNVILYYAVRYDTFSDEAEGALMSDDRMIVLTGDKGGVGKSTLAALFTEWLLARGTPVRLIDADPNQTSQTWADKCKALGYEVSTPDAPVTIVDTAGTSGSSLTKYIREADIIVVPFQPHVADLETVVGWFLSINPALQKRVVFVPNRLTTPTLTKEQREGMQQIRDVLQEQGRGRLTPGLSNRPAVYPPLLNGRKENFFRLAADEKVKQEVEAVFNDIMRA